MTSIRGFELFTQIDPAAHTKLNTLAFWMLAQLGGGFKVVDNDLTAPPGSPTTGAVYIIAASATGAWSGKDGQFAGWDGTQWLYLAPTEGDQARVLDENTNVVYDGSAWGAI